MKRADDDVHTEPGQSVSQTHLRIVRVQIVGVIAGVEHHVEAARSRILSEVTGRGREREREEGEEVTVRKGVKKQYDDSL